MSYDLRTCRICREQSDDRKLWKYGTRHYAHWDCYFAVNLKKAEDCRRFPESLRTHELGAMPVFMFSDHYQSKFGRSQWKARHKEAMDLVHKIYRKKQPGKPRG